MGVLHPVYVSHHPIVHVKDLVITDNMSQDISSHHVFSYHTLTFWSLVVVLTLIKLKFSLHQKYNPLVRPLS